MERILEVGTHKHTVVACMDEPGPGGACHEYGIRPVNQASDGKPWYPFASVHFQKGPVKEAGVNGCHHEDLLAIVIDRLEHFQKGEYRCRANALAVTKIEEALHWLNHRTADRAKRGVEGLSEK